MEGEAGQWGGTPHSPWHSTAKAEGGKGQQGPVLCTVLSTDEMLCEHRGESWGSLYSITL